MILEPVDSEYVPVQPGEPSATVLLTDLSNRVQPIIRYDIGDSMVQRHDPCECGSPLPAIRVSGRQDDILHFASDGETVDVLPLAIKAGLEVIPDLERVQLIQVGRSELSVRMSCLDESRTASVWLSVSGALRGFLDRQGLQRVSVNLDDQPPSDLGLSGKFRQVIALD